MWFLLDLFERISLSRIAFIGVIVSEVISMIVMNFIFGNQLTKYAMNQPIPDIRFRGYTVSELNGWYEAIGVDGCKIYSNAALFDLFPYMELYALCFGTLLCHQIKLAHPYRTWLKRELTLLFPLVMMFDVVETTITFYGASMYSKHQQRLPDVFIHVASTCTQMKWTLFLTGFSLLTGLVIDNYIVRRSKNEKQKGR